MAVHQLLPNATVAGGVISNVMPAYGQIWQVLADADTATWIWCWLPTPGPVPSSPPTRVRLSNPPTLPAGCQIRRVQAFMAGYDNLYSTYYLGIEPGSKVGVNSHPRRYSAFPTGSLFGAGVLVGAEPMTVQPDGLPWDQASLDDLDLFIHSGTNATGYSPTTFQHIVARALAEVEVNERSVATLIGPATLTPTSTPTILWSYTDPDGDPQDAYDLRVFPSSVASAPGFDPATSSGAVISTGITYGNARRYDVPTEKLLPPGSYESFLRSADVGSGLRWSAWHQRTFTVFYSPPAPATITATANPAGDRVNLSISWPAGSTSVSVQRSLDGGVSWVPLRWGTFAVNTAGGSVGIADYEAPLGVPIQYRVQAYAVSGAPPTLITMITNWSAPTAPVELPLRWWLTDPWQPIDNSIPLILRNAPLRMRRRERVGFVEPLGRNRSVWTADTVLGEELELELIFLDRASFDAFDALRGRQVTFLLRSDQVGLQWYVRLGGERVAEIAVSNRSHSTTEPTITATISATEVDA